MDVDDNICETSHLPSLQLSLSQLLRTVDEQTPRAAYSSMSPACSLPVWFDSPTMHNCITHHHTSLFNASLSPTFSSSHHKVWLKISSADGGWDCLVVISAGLHTLFFSRLAILALFSSVGRCVRGDVSCTACVLSVCMRVGVYERQMFV